MILLAIWNLISESEWKLLLIKEQECVGQLPGGADVYKINKIAILPLCLDEPKDLDIEVRIIWSNLLIFTYLEERKGFFF